MLNGQLQLTDMNLGVSMTRLRRPVFVAGVLSLAILAGCASKGTRAPVVDLAGGQPSAPAQPGGSYVVKPGDTLYKIARANNVDIENIKRWNNLSDPNQISVGQVLKMSGSSGGVAQPAPIASNKAQPRPLDQPADTSGTATASLPPPAPAPTPAETKPATRAADAGVINWAWPAGGQIMQGFNNNSKGIDIAGALGDPVTAAADGKVMYSGNGVRGLGNLIIVNHQNGFITAYAHNRTLLVKTGQDVKRGAKIAEIGQSDTTSPRLHFEIRRQGTPVDPMQYLPAK
ncbi:MULTISPECIES: peptidoglycan DD-metalloendopeptidase family protein [Achromobacter]|jgi:lipoprotein NlpD|uniref:Peptidoglycan DD-metalloendopeptidase family protein n=1 Tax=Alcaligenes xylosoxydans xylosoxydans TaxID=85698 RepID=A0A9X3KVM0_ALCXX|nr:peptidoglycan DD-metalloendopeptidase family protein [Achromobacter xylosoxidans]MCH4572459.1 peptidoglycan DD-metalloendopeptidase family protein [Achromobacter xylosoxidans]MCZ8400888.1 peptidoglycan DD-metalloendopeptidase family protein [Achromobacter xylosoxidans]MCZ8439350.1 peptidoglycan DD-metalloendopeptidase family protein [Achromobacter xylosoxidans]MDD7989633.1 peptidoglycan DD-metalloendopeptidase family protein [Achromobacter xylosoxidans]NYS12822.1 peptidoglycan DD-metalloend